MQKKTPEERKRTAKTRTKTLAEILVPVLRATETQVMRIKAQQTAAEGIVPLDQVQAESLNR